MGTPPHQLRAGYRGPDPDPEHSLPTAGPSEGLFHEWRRGSRRQGLIAQSVKNLPVVQKTQVQFQGQEDPLQKEMATDSSTLA